MKRDRVIISTPFIKLDSFLKFCGYAESGAAAKLMVQDGQITVNGALCTQRGRKLRPGDTVDVGGKVYEVAGSEG
jgi:ribosome-associated protein